MTIRRRVLAHWQRYYGFDVVSLRFFAHFLSRFLISFQRGFQRLQRHIQRGFRGIFIHSTWNDVLSSNVYEN